jgi:hypothetical protein
MARAAGRKRQAAAPRADADPVVQAYLHGVDRTLIRENLRRSVEERFLRLMELQRFAEELRRAGREARRGR